MKSIIKIFEKAKGNPVMLAGSILSILILIFSFAVLAGAILIFGLNLMGIGIPYTLKTISGASIVILCLRSTGGSSN
jgi:hypothetical protein